MRIAYFDCFSGVSGDMCLGALLHAGVPLEALQAEIAKLGVPGFALRAERTWRDAMEGYRVDVVVDAGHEPPRRGLGDVQAILAGSALDPVTKERATRVFTRLAEAEAKVHGTTPDAVHFHEVGAIDAIVDVVGTVAGLGLLGVEEVFASRLTLGRGLAACAHGEMPVPVPATLELLAGAPVQFSAIEGELVTPTGAALISTLARRIGATLSMVPHAVGYGFGARTREDGPPNALRLVVGDAIEPVEEVVLLETNLDDVPGQVVGFLVDRCLAEGALDAWSTPIQMKKSRPGTLFSVLADDARAEALEHLVFRETGSLGVRRQRVARAKLERRIESVETSLGAVRVKYSRGPAGLARAAPEYEDVARIAAERGLGYRRALEQIQRELPAWPAKGKP